MDQPTLLERVIIINRQWLNTSLTRNAVVAAGKKAILAFFPLATTAFLALEGAKCCDTE